jgi:hypothetical protein
LRENVVTNSTLFGLALFYASPTVWNSSFLGSQNGDVFLLDETSPNGSRPTLVNVSFDKDALAFENSFPQQNNSVDVEWFLTVRTIGPDSSPLEGATVTLRDAFNGTAAPQSTDVNGNTPLMVTREFVARDTDQSGRAEAPGERSYFTPHTVTATWGPFSATQIVTMDRSRTVTFVLGELANVTVTRAPPKGNVTIDGDPAPAPSTSAFLVGSNHTVEAPAVDEDGDGTRQLFLNWSDGGDRAHAVVVPAQDITLTAYYRTQHRLRLTLPGTDADHAALLSVTDNGTSRTISVWGPWEGWADAGTEASLSDCASGEPRRCTADPHRWTITAPLDAAVAYSADNWKPLVAALFAFTIALVGMLTARKYPLPHPRHPVAKTWVVCVLPIVLLEAATGILSHFTGLLAIPPLLGLGTAVDVLILLLGLLGPYVFLRRAAAARILNEGEPLADGAVAVRGYIMVHPGDAIWTSSAT